MARRSHRGERNKTLSLPILLGLLGLFIFLVVTFFLARQEQVKRARAHDIDTPLTLVNGEHVQPHMPVKLIAETGEHAAGKVHAELRFDPTKVHLTEDVHVNSQLGTIHKVTSRDEANATGKIEIEASPHTGSQDLHGTFEVASLKFQPQGDDPSVKLDERLSHIYDSEYNDIKMALAQAAESGISADFARPEWWNVIPQNLRDFLELLYIWVFQFRRPTNLGHLLDGVVPSSDNQPGGTSDTVHLAITQPSHNSHVSGNTVTVRYGASGDQATAGVDHVHLQLDSQAEIRDTDFDGTHTFTDVSAGSHTVGGYLARADHSKIPGTDIQVSFTTGSGSTSGGSQPPPPPPPGPPPPNGNAPSGGLGTHTGDGLEVGINLPRLNQLKAEAAQGMYDRACIAAEHDRTKWHTLVNPDAKCHYDHQHGDDPNYVNDIFGQPGAWFENSGQSISYPWQTFAAKTANESNEAYIASKTMENDAKHEGYIWIVRRDQNCSGGDCVRDFRVATHIHGNFDMPVRYHSYLIEARVCRTDDLSTCGIVRYGGWGDYGRLFTTAPGAIDCGHGVNEQYIPLPADTLYRPIERPDSRDEIRCHPNMTSLPSYPPSRPHAEWWLHGGGETRFQVRIYDPMGNVDSSDPTKLKYFCRQEDANCKFDNSILGIFVGYTLHVPEYAGGRNLDSNGDGRTDYKGYFTRWGGSNNSCSSPGLDCIPYEYNNVTRNFFMNKEARYAHDPCDNCARVDHDISPPGKKWITWFYKYPHTIGR